MHTPRKADTAEAGIQTEALSEEEHKAHMLYRAVSVGDGGEFDIEVEAYVGQLNDAGESTVTCSITLHRWDITDQVALVDVSGTVWVTMEGNLTSDPKVITGAFRGSLDVDTLAGGRGGNPLAQLPPVGLDLDISASAKMLIFPVSSLEEFLANLEVQVNVSLVLEIYTDKADKEAQQKAAAESSNNSSSAFGVASSLGGVEDRKSVV